MNPWTVALAAWAWSAALFSAVALARLWRGRRLAKRTATLPLPAVLLLRPVDAPTRSERESLAAPVDYPGALEQVVLSPFPLDLPGHLRWLPSDPPTRNRKVGHLLYALSVLETQGRVVLAVDADVRVDGALVAALAEPLSQGAALSTAAPEPMVGRGWG
ncbi:MAG TPA: carotenoid biosynthesis protein, partial [Myxococcaceae bacterium]|nr:carotenoid biosynthesis protein [Myxococcaceae bacterium]